MDPPDVTLEQLLDTQRVLQEHMRDGDPRRLEGEARVEFIRWNALALVVELGEALDHVGWKPWAEGGWVEERPAMEELVDALHFLLNLFLAVGHGGWDGGSVRGLAGAVATAYQEKVGENIRRQLGGYRG